MGGGPDGGGIDGIPGGGGMGRNPGGGGPLKPKCGGENGPSFAKPRLGGTKPGGPIVYGGCLVVCLKRIDLLLITSDEIGFDKLILEVSIFSRGVLFSAFMYISRSMG